MELLFSGLNKRAVLKGKLDYRVPSVVIPDDDISGGRRGFQVKDVSGNIPIKIVQRGLFMDGPGFRTVVGISERQRQRTGEGGGIRRSVSADGYGRHGTCQREDAKQRRHFLKGVPPSRFHILPSFLKSSLFLYFLEYGTGIPSQPSYTGSNKKGNRPSQGNYTILLGVCKQKMLDITIFISTSIVFYRQADGERSLSNS